MTSPVLTPETAVDYAKRVTAGTNVVTITGAVAMEDDGLEVVRVSFDQVFGGKTYHETMDVWVEDGKLYGEW